ncbi:MAG: polysaccharide deacetylase family protein [Desulfovibrio sp.]
MGKKPLAVVISLDVEEEGLFSGSYPREGAGLSNIARLRKLAFLPRDFDLPLTFLCDYPVAVDPASGEMILDLVSRVGGEIGAHLHPWNTPPFPDMPWPEPVSTAVMPLDVFRAKLATLQQAVTAFAGAPAVSFRMGRWNLFKRAMAVLPEVGFLVDSSVAPLRHVPNGPDHFLAPADPYWLRPAGPEGKSLLEAPTTQVPLVPGTPRLAHALAKRLSPKAGNAVLGGFMKTATLGVNPVWMPEATMRLAVRTHVRRGGRVITLFWHSSELLPGASPHFPDEEAATAFLAKVRRFADWLRRTFDVRGATLKGLAGPAFSWPDRSSPATRPCSTGDWGC